MIGQYDVRFVPPDANPHPVDENVDVEVVFADGVRFVATVFTLENIRGRMRSYQQTGECLGGRYFWAADMVIIDRLTIENVRNVVADLLQAGEFQAAFAGPYFD